MSGIDTAAYRAEHIITERWGYPEGPKEQGGVCESCGQFWGEQCEPLDFCDALDASRALVEEKDGLLRAAMRQKSAMRVRAKDAEAQRDELAEKLRAGTVLKYAHLATDREERAAKAEAQVAAIREKLAEWREATLLGNASLVLDTIDAALGEAPAKSGDVAAEIARMGFSGWILTDTGAENRGHRRSCAVCGGTRDECDFGGGCERSRYNLLAKSDPLAGQVYQDESPWSPEPPVEYPAEPPHEFFPISSVVPNECGEMLGKWGTMHYCHKPAEDPVHAVMCRTCDVAMARIGEDSYICPACGAPCGSAG